MSDGKDLDVEDKVPHRSFFSWQFNPRFHHAHGALGGALVCFPIIFYLSVVNLGHVVNEGDEGHVGHVGS
jgi:hypothetical protein